MKQPLCEEVIAKRVEDFQSQENGSSPVSTWSAEKMRTTFRHGARTLHLRYRNLELPEGRRRSSKSAQETDGTILNSMVESQSQQMTIKRRPAQTNGVQSAELEAQEGLTQKVEDGIDGLRNRYSLHLNQLETIVVTLIVENMTKKIELKLLRLVNMNALQELRGNMLENDAQFSLINFIPREDREDASQLSSEDVLSQYPNIVRQRQDAIEEHLSDKYDLEALYDESIDLSEPMYEYEANEGDTESEADVDDVDDVEILTSEVAELFDDANQDMDGLTSVTGFDRLRLHSSRFSRKC